MAEPIVINIMDRTQGITAADLSTPLLVATDAKMDVRKISSIDDLAGVSTNIYKMAAAALAQRPQEIYVAGFVPDSGVVTGDNLLEYVKTLDIPYYYFGTDLRKGTDIAPLAAYFGARLGFYVAAGELTAPADDLVALAGNLASESVQLMAHKGKTADGTTYGEAFADMAMIGKMAPVLSGTAAFFYQSLDGVPDGGYSKADVTKLYDGNVSTVTTYMKRVETWGGKTTKGTYCHFKILKDWLHVRLKEALAKHIHQDQTVFLSDDGLAGITAAMKEIMDVGKDGRGVFVEYEIHTPLRAEIPANDRANGIVNGYQIRVTFTGFVEKVTVNIIAEV